MTPEAMVFVEKAKLYNDHGCPHYSFVSNMSCTNDLFVDNNYSDTFRKKISTSRSCYNGSTSQLLRDIGQRHPVPGMALAGTRDNWGINPQTWHDELVAEYRTLKDAHPEINALVGLRIKPVTEACKKAFRKFGVELDIKKAFLLEDPSSYQMEVDYAGYYFVGWQKGVLVVRKEDCTPIELASSLEVEIKNFSAYNFFSLFNNQDRGGTLTKGFNVYGDHRNSCEMIPHAYNFFHNEVPEELMELGRAATAEMIKYNVNQGEVMSDICRISILKHIAKAPERWITLKSVAGIAKILLQDTDAIIPVIASLEKHMAKLIKSNEPKST